jgi:tRNA threonylcarbamoyladenosine biosynthesis protein TsaB
MNVLALDTATSATVAAVVRGDGTAFAARDEVSAGERPRHAMRLLELAAATLEQAELGWAALERIAVGIGPGSFTGLRIGLATARGLALANGAELVGVGTLRALAHGAASENPVLAVIDARRGEAFVAGYLGGKELIAPCAVAPDAIAELLAVGPGWLGIGEGAVRFREQLERAGVDVPDDRSPLHPVSGEAIGRMAASDDIDARGALTPLYLRVPDAELRLRNRR